MLLSMAGFSQISKADAQAFLERNPIHDFERVAVWEGQVNYSFFKDKLVSLTAAESGFLLVSKSPADVPLESFYPYASIKFIVHSSDNKLIITLRD